MTHLRGAWRPAPVIPFLLPIVLLGACDLRETTTTSGGTTPASPGLFDEAASFAGVTGSPSATAGSAFWEHWGDGRAELSSYRIRTARYDEPREGELVLIYVTEPHDRRTWIKDDGVEAPERTEVLKLNAHLEFLTGIYPYSVMTSVFSPVDDWGGHRFRPVRINLSVQEWCGSYRHQVWPGVEGLRSLRVSYFASDGEQLREDEVPSETLYEDALLIQLRELDGEFANGGDWEGWLVPSLWNVRRGEAAAEPVRATIRREDPVSGAEVPLTRFTLEYGEYSRTYDVEAAYPHRVVGWRTSTGDTATLAETRRLPYWQLNDPEGRRQRSELGLDPGSTGRPPAAP